MKLFEILDTCPDVQWSKQNHEHRGVFTMNGTRYTIHIDEYVIGSSNKTLLDIGFDTDGSIDSKNQTFPAATVIGGVSNSIITRLKTIDFDIIMLSALKSDAAHGSRLSLYATIAKRFTRTLPRLLCCSDWFGSSTASYMFVTRSELSTVEIDEIKNTVKMK